MLKIENSSMEITEVRAADFNAPWITESGAAPGPAFNEPSMDIRQPGYFPLIEAEFHLLEDMGLVEYGGKPTGVELKKGDVVNVRYYPAHKPPNGKKESLFPAVDWRTLSQTKGYVPPYISASPEKVTPRYNLPLSETQQLALSIMIEEFFECCDNSRVNSGEDFIQHMMC